MTRRALGVAVLCVALLCSVLVAKAGGLRVAGIAALPPGLDAPTVGDCLSSVSGPIAGAPPSTTSIDSVGQTAVTFGDCARDHLGEVVAFRRQPGRSTDTAGVASIDPADSNGASAESDGEWCQRISFDYRSSASYLLRNASAGLWVPATGQRFVAILSAPSVDPARQRWAACAVVAPELETYHGLYVSSLAQGITPAPFGLCRSGDAADHWVSCITPHRTQVFGTAAGGPALPASQENSACHGLIEAMTGMADVSAGGALRVDVASGGSGQAGAGSAAVAAGASNTDNPGTGDLTRDASCRLSVVGEGELVGTLIGVGQGRLPLG
jgi:hypothetical protein